MSDWNFLLSCSVEFYSGLSPDYMIYWSLKELGDSVSIPDKLFSNPLYNGLSKKFVKNLVVHYRLQGGSGWNPGKSLRKVRKEMVRMLQKCKTTEP